MFKTLRNALKIPELRKKMIYTCLLLVVIRIGCQLPLPCIDAVQVKNSLSSVLGDSFSLLNSFTGGSFENMSLFALNVTPYITASIIMQLLTIAIPALEELQRDGEDGRKKINNITRYVTIALAVLESIGIAVGFGRSGALDKYNFTTVATIVIILTAGSALVMWIGERITEKGVGNGISIILLVNIVSRMPNDLTNLYKQFVKNKQFVQAGMAVGIIVLVILVTVVFVIVLQDAERRIPVQYAKKVQGRKLMGGQATYIPLKVNTAGVIPVIFASSILQAPTVIINLCNIKSTNTTATKILAVLNSNNWFSKTNPKYSVGVIIYVALILFFAYFYTSITFNPIEVSNNMKKQGGFVPGIRPGKPTTEYLNKILNYIILIGAVGLTLVALIPMFFNGAFSADVSFGGTSLIIVVGVILETIKAIESQMLVRNYSGFLND